MQYLESKSGFSPKKQCFKAKDRETKGKMANMYCQIAVNLTSSFSCVNYMYIFKCIFTANHIIYIFAYVLIPSTFVYDPSYLPVKSVKELCLSTCASSFINLSASVLLNFHLH